MIVMYEIDEWMSVSAHANVYFVNRVIYEASQIFVIHGTKLNSPRHCKYDE